MLQHDSGKVGADDWSYKCKMPGWTMACVLRFALWRDAKIEDLTTNLPQGESSDKNQTLNKPGLAET